MGSIRKVIGQDSDRGLKLVNILRFQPRSAISSLLPSQLYAGWTIAFQTEAIPMADLARKMPESSHLAGLSVGSIDLANEKHYSVIEISKLWALSQKTVRRIFEREPGVIQWGSTETRHKRGYRTLRVPETVLLRIHRKLRRAS
jgi:hypothetical protein